MTELQFGSSLWVVFVARQDRLAGDDIEFCSTTNHSCAGLPAFDTAS